MTDESPPAEQRGHNPEPHGEKRDAATIAAMVSAGASVVSASAAIWQATHNGQSNDPPPPQPDPPPPSIELPPGVDPD